MACRKVFRNKKFLPAALVTGEKKPCAFCQREVDDEVTYGKLYEIGGLQCHYFCVLLSCCLVQKGKDTEGLFGFLYPDIVAEIERSKKHRCSYCGKGGASLGCCVSQCRKQFHLPCGREKNAISLFFGNYKSYCQMHAPKQKIPDHIMAVARVRLKKAKTYLKQPESFSNLKELCAEQSCDGTSSETESVCVICYEAVQGYPTVNTFWPVCCARDAWFHRSCLQRMALSAGMHYLKCPLCNDKDNFYNAVLDQGFYVPDRDAAWELEQNAFAEIYERPLSCSAELCKCPLGRNHDAEKGEWDIKLCVLCGTAGCHAGCADETRRFVCVVCRPAAPRDLATLLRNLDTLAATEQTTTDTRRVMPSRMSLRRTKGSRAHTLPSTSRIDPDNTATEACKESNTTLSRLELNLKTPRKLSTRNQQENNENADTKKTEIAPSIAKKLSPNKMESKSMKDIEKNSSPMKNISNVYSPMKMLMEGLNMKIKCLGVQDLDTHLVVDRLKRQLGKPKPLSAKKRIVNDLLEHLFDDIIQEIRETKEPRTPIKTESDTDINENTDCNLTSSTPIKAEAKSPEKENVAIEKNEILPLVENIENSDDTSRSTFELPPEFIAEGISDDSLTLCETPKKLKLVEIKKDSSLEISEDNQVVNIDMIKMENVSNNQDFVVKIPLDDTSKVLDDSFKSYYLTEVDKDFKCSFNHNHRKDDESPEKCSKLRSAIDFAMDAAKKLNETTKKSKKEQKKRKLIDIPSRKLKRKLENKDGVPSKKRKQGKNTVVLNYKKNKSNIEVVCSKDSAPETIDLTVNKSSQKSKGKKFSNKKTVRENIRLKIRFKKEQVRLKITNSETKRVKEKKSSNSPNSPSLRQYVLKYSHSSPSKIIAKPDEELTPIVRKYIKLEKSPDNLVQTSIQKFFKVVPTANFGEK